MLIRGVLPTDDLDLFARIERLLSESDMVLRRRSPAEFWSQQATEPFDLVLIERRELPGEAGSAIARLRAQPDHPEVVVLRREDRKADTAALQAAGSFAIVRLNLSDRQLGSSLRTLVRRCQEMRAVRLQADHHAPPPVLLHEVVSNSPATTRLVQLSARVARADTSLLIVGETGTGKEWLARAIHTASPRASAPFVAVNCGALPESLLESELFGHEKGAFTGATRARRGYFELAHRGTLFLDEIGEMPYNLQVRLLRVLQDQYVQRLGSEEPTHLDLRVIAATSRDLPTAIEEREFRQDLYFRLAVVTLTVPPLRHRREDITALAELFLERFRRKLVRPEIEGLTPAAQSALVRYRWPGNVRELINVIERALLLCDGRQVDLPDLPDEIAQAADPDRTETAASWSDEEWLAPWLDRPFATARQEVVERFEQIYLSRLLRENHGQIGRCAQRAGIDPRTLFNKMRQLGLRKEDFK